MFFAFYYLLLFLEKIKSDLAMLVLLSCAKTMSETSKVKVPLKTIPRFQKRGCRGCFADVAVFGGRIGTSVACEC